MFELLTSEVPGTLAGIRGLKSWNGGWEGNPVYQRWWRLDKNNGRQLGSNLDDRLIGHQLESC